MQEAFHYIHHHKNTNCNKSKKIKSENHLKYYYMNVFTSIAPNKIFFEFIIDFNITSKNTFDNYE